jgi:hypothetical protein
MNSPERLADSIRSAVNQWLECCRRHGRISRNTVAVGIVALDHLVRKCPLETNDVFSQGGELKGARSALGNVLERHGVDRRYLKEVTTRQSPHDAGKLLIELDYGKQLCGLEDEARHEVLRPAIELLVQVARNHLSRKHIKIGCNRQAAPAVWVHKILEEATGRSGGVVEQHLVGAKLQERFPSENVPNYPGHAGDAQTGRDGDFTIGTTAFHVTAAPGLPLIDKCKANIDRGLHPFLLVPSAKVEAASILAETARIQDQISVMAIEDFISSNVIELSEGKQDDFLEVLRRIIDTYNTRLDEVETDLSLKIELQ